MSYSLQHLDNTGDNGEQAATITAQLGSKRTRLYMELDHAVLADDSVTLDSPDFIVTITSPKAGMIGKAFYDLFENQQEA